MKDIKGVERRHSTPGRRGLRLPRNRGIELMVGWFRRVFTKRCWRSSGEDRFTLRAERSLYECGVFMGAEDARTYGVTFEQHDDRYGAPGNGGRSGGVWKTDHCSYAGKYYAGRQCPGAKTAVAAASNLVCRRRIAGGEGRLIAESVTVLMQAPLRTSWAKKIKDLSERRREAQITSPKYGRWLIRGSRKREAEGASAEDSDGQQRMRAYAILSGMGAGTSLEQPGSPETTRFEIADLRSGLVGTAGNEFFSRAARVTFRLSRWAWVGIAKFSPQIEEMGQSRRPS